jgi:hypothetical protein
MGSTRQGRSLLRFLFVLLLSLHISVASGALPHLEEGMWFTPSVKLQRPEFYLSSGELLPDYVESGWQSVNNDSLSIFIFGDSLDRMLVSTVCTVNATHSHVAPPRTGSDYFPRDMQPGCPRGAWDKESFACRAGKLSVANLFFRGFLYAEARNELCEPGLPQPLLPSFELAAEHYVAQFGIPQVVLLKSFFWELRWICARASDGDFPCADLGNDRRAVSDILQMYETAVVGALRKLRALFPTAVVVLKTDPLYNHTSNRFAKPAHKKAVLNSVENVFYMAMELNKVFRRVGLQEHAPVLDTFRTFLGLDPKVYLRDDIHLRDEYSQTILNMIIHSHLHDKWA